MEGSQIIVKTALITLALTLPGLAVTLAVFPRKEQLKYAERLGLSFLFGAVPQLVIYFGSVNLGVPINSATSALAIAGVTAAGVVVWRLRTMSPEASSS
jgi:uncharacterized membrane protein